MRRLGLAALTFLCLSALGCGLKPACRGPDDTAASVPAVPSPTAGFFVYAHAHNDYEHERPLFDALERRFHSVEADVYLRGDALLVSHGGWAYKGSLKDLYLDPLQKRVDEHGTVLGDGEPFYLWIDFKDEDPRTPDVLRELLGGYSMLTRFAEEGITQAPVVVVLTGFRVQKSAFVAGKGPHPATRDSNDFSWDDPPADFRWRFYALKYSDYVSWGGKGDPSAEDLRRLRCLAFAARSTGRKLRLWAAPDTRDYWRVALDVGIDFVNTDDLAGLSGYLNLR